MPSLSIRPCTICELEHATNIGELMAEYAQESSIPEIGSVSAQWNHYKSMESSGLLHSFAAFEDGELIGFLLMVATVLPHYGVMMAATESFFVAQSARNTGAGLALLKAAEEAAKNIGAKGILISAPIGSRLDQIMPKLGQHTNNVYLRGLA